VAKSRGRGHEFLEPEEYEAWNALLMLNRTVLAELDTALQSAHNLTVMEFDVLITLFNADHNRLGMTALGESVMLSPAGTSHLVTRLERDGLVRREVDPADGRKWFTVLTPAGDEALRSARATHNDVLRRSIFRVTSAGERRTLQRIWRRLGAPS
jgi:DNA-binding MarR family transcriptional regulator